MHHLVAGSWNYRSTFLLCFLICQLPLGYSIRWNLINNLGLKGLPRMSTQSGGLHSWTAFSLVNFLKTFPCSSQHYLFDIYHYWRSKTWNQFDAWISNQIGRFSWLSSYNRWRQKRVDFSTAGSDTWIHFLALCHVLIFYDYNSSCQICLPL